MNVLLIPEVITGRCYPTKFSEGCLFWLNLYILEMKDSVTIVIIVMFCFCRDLQQNLYEQFLIKEVKKIFVANQLIVAFQPESMPSSKKTMLCNKLLSAGYSPEYYPEDVV